MTGHNDAREMIQTIGLPAGENCRIRPPHFGDYKKAADLAEPLGYPSTVQPTRMRIERMCSDIIHFSCDCRNFAG
jgi:hypothetical protein